MSGLEAQKLLDALALTDGVIADATAALELSQLAVSAAEAAALLARDELFESSDVVAFDCGNDVPSAVVLLALLASGRTFVLLPPITASTVPDVSVENFSQVRLRAGWRGDTHPAIELGTAEISLSVRRSPNCSGMEERREPQAVFIPTSGTTGQAKLVRHRHARLFGAAHHAVERLGLGHTDRIAIPVPIAHMYGLGAALLPALLAGASIDLQANANALRYIARERSFGPNIAFLTPSFGDALIRIRRGPRPYRMTVMAGDRLPADLFDRYEQLHGPLVNLYGSTELGVIAAGDPTDLAPRRRDMIGRLMPAVSLTTDSDAKVVGLLWFHHEFGFDLYVDRFGHAVCEPDGTLASGDNFCSGDFGRLVGGYLEVHGRGDDWVNRDGLLIACSDVAATLAALDEIVEAVVLAGPMSRRGRELVAFCVPSAKRAGDAQSVRKACLKVLPSRAVPDRIVFLPGLPQLANGKVDRQELHRRHGLEATLSDARS